MSQFFPNIGNIAYEGATSKNPLAFKHYNPAEVIEGKTMRDHLRFSVVYWHTIRWVSGDMFGVERADRRKDQFCIERWTIQSGCRRGNYRRRKGGLSRRSSFVFSGRVTLPMPRPAAIMQTKEKVEATCITQGGRWSEIAAGHVTTAPCIVPPSASSFAR